MQQTIRNQIEKKLKFYFSPLYLLVSDESNEHNVSQSSESHFRIILVTDKFLTQQIMVVRHQTVYQLLANELSNGVHALRLYLYTSNEWQQRQNTIFPISVCYCKNRLN